MTTAAHTAEHAELVRVGQTLRMMRDVVGLTEGDLARLSRLSRTRYGQIEHGERKASRRDLSTIAGAMGRHAVRAEIEQRPAKKWPALSQVATTQTPLVRRRPKQWRHSLSSLECVHQARVRRRSTD